MRDGGAPSKEHLLASPDFMMEVEAISVLN